ncbi:MAG: hypothetical protein M5U09_13610 [Gammaproteobacteria bacterium]|nr:hypothetical protein [Gammaproteobacteria bacterium]
MGLRAAAVGRPVHRGPLPRRLGPVLGRGFWDEAWHPVRRSWVQATQTTRAKRWRERRRYRYQRVRWESIETRATREPRVTSRTFALVGLQAPDQVPDSLRLAIEPRAAA